MNKSNQKVYLNLKTIYSMEEKVFTYGTLQKPEVQMKIIGRIINSNPDILKGFRKSTIEVNKNRYPIIIEDGNSNEEIDGKILVVNTEELIKLDKYETKAYQRKKVILKSGISAWAYQK